MDSDRKAAIVVGVLFIIATLSAVVQFPLIGSTNAEDYLTQIAADGGLVTTAVLLDLLMIVAILSIPVVLFPILKKHSESLARGYVVARVFETMPLVVSAICLLLLVTLSREYVAAGTADSPGFRVLGSWLLAAYDQTLVIGGQIVFGLTALVLNFALYRSRLIPRFLSAWGLIGVPLMLTGGVLVMFGAVSDFSTIQTALMLPLAVQEMVFAVWLIVRGFSPSNSVAARQS